MSNPHYPYRKPGCHDCLWGRTHANCPPDPPKLGYGCPRWEWAHA